MTPSATYVRVVLRVEVPRMDEADATQWAVAAACQGFLDAEVPIAFVSAQRIKEDGNDA